MITFFEYLNKPFSSRSVTYSFNCANDKNALYINFDLLAPLPFVASSINLTMSVLLLYFIIESTSRMENEYLWEGYIRTNIILVIFY